MFVTSKCIKECWGRGMQKMNQGYKFFYTVLGVLCIFEADCKSSAEYVTTE